MGIIDNLDFSNIDLSQFRKFKCLCELCDCGCFERSKQEHNPECKHKLKKSASFRSRSELTTVSKKCYLSHYNEVYKSNYNPRPATAFIPPKDLFLYVPKGNMDLTTIQKVDFKKYEPQERVKPFVKHDNHERSEEPLSGMTAYRAEFVPKENSGLANIVKRNSNESSMRRPLGTGMAKNTTNKDHFKEWTGSVSKGFSEYPSFAGFSIFPNRERSFHTSTKTFHPPIDVTKLEPVQKIEFKGNLKNEGEMNMATSYRDTFVKYENSEAAKKIVPKSHGESVLSSNKKKAISGTTQTRADFVQYHNHVPPKPADVNPFVSMLNKQIYPGNNRDHNTIYSSEFIQKELTKTKTCKKEDPPYEKPTEKFESETVTQRDFKPIDISKVPALKVLKIPHTHLKIPAGPMESKTMAMVHFVPYDVKPRIAYSDPNPDYYIPPTNAKFNGETTTNQTFRGEKGERAKLLKPDGDNIKIDKSESFEDSTSYKNTFKNHGLSMCEAKAYIIAQSFAQMREKTTLINSESNTIQT